MAARFWVGGTGTWDNATTTHWSATTGGAGGASVPAAADDVTFDGASGGGTVTVAATINGSNTLSSITFGAFTGTLNFSTNNPNVTLTGLSSANNASLDGRGTGARTLNMGNGIWTFSTQNGSIVDFFTTTNLTFNANSSTIAVTGTPNNDRFFNSGGLTFNTVTVASNGTSNGRFLITESPTITTLTISPSNHIFFNSSATIGTFNVSGTAYNSSVLLLGAGSGTTITISTAATISWSAIAGLTFTGSHTANNSFDLGGNTGITITGPSGGGGGAGPMVGS